VGPGLAGRGFPFGGWPEPLCCRLRERGDPVSQCIGCDPETICELNVYCVPAFALGHAHISGSVPQAHCVSYEGARHTVPSPTRGEGTLWHRSAQPQTSIRVDVCMP